MSKFGAALNEQIGYEFAASQQYIAVAVYYDAETLPQLAGHFYRQAVEERNHAMIIVQYLLDANEKVVIPPVETPQVDFADAVAPVSLALVQEIAVRTERRSQFVDITRDVADAVREERGRAVLVFVPHTTAGVTINEH